MKKLLQRIFGPSKVANRWKRIQEQGEFLAERNFESFHIDLYLLRGARPAEVHYYEVWKKHGLNQIYWIECQPEEYILKIYITLSGLKA